MQLGQKFEGCLFGVALLINGPLHVLKTDGLTLPGFRALQGRTLTLTLCRFAVFTVVFGGLCITLVPTLVFKS